MDDLPHQNLLMTPLFTQETSRVDMVCAGIAVATASINNLFPSKGEHIYIYIYRITTLGLI